MTVTCALTGCCLLASTLLAPTRGAAATAPAGCGKTLASGVYQIMDQNLTRTYRVFVPSDHRPGISYPLVMVIQGWGEDENEFIGDRSVTTLADQRGYIVVAPRGLGSAAPNLSQRPRRFVCWGRNSPGPLTRPPLNVRDCL